MLVILRENIDNLGRIGDLVKVSDGYARNFLLPRKLVAEADEKNVAAIEHQKKLLEKKRLALRASSEELAKKLETLTLSISRKVHVEKGTESNKLFGSVTAQNITDLIHAQGYTAVTKHMVRIGQPIKTLGQHSVEVRLEPEVISTVQIIVTKEA